MHKEVIMLRDNQKNPVSQPFLLVKHTSVVFLLFTVVFINIFISSNYSGNLKIYTLDVGQGDSILIESPDSKYLLIDGGPDDSILSELSNVIPFWRKKIDYILLTHPDLDHVGGLPEVVKRYAVGEVFMANIEEGNINYKEFKKMIINKNIRSNDLRAGDNLLLGCCVQIKVLWPSKNIKYDEVDDINDISTAIEIKYKRFNGFFAGDLSLEYEEEIFSQNPIDIDFLKVGHHGSLTSTSKEFLEIARPEIAVIGVGKNNKYGHPTDEIMSNLNQVNAKIYNTAEDGTIIIESDGEKIWVED